MIDMAELLAFRAAAEVDEVAIEGVLPEYAARAKTRMDTVEAVVYAREAIPIRELITAHGASSFGQARSSASGATARSPAVTPSSNPAIGAEVYGRALLGFADGVTPLV